MPLPKQGLLNKSEELHFAELKEEILASVFSEEELEEIEGPLVSKYYGKSRKGGRKRP